MSRYLSLINRTRTLQVTLVQQENTRLWYHTEEYVPELHHLIDTIILMTCLANHCLLESQIIFSLNDLNYHTKMKITYIQKQINDLTPLLFFSSSRRVRPHLNCNIRRVSQQIKFSTTLVYSAIYVIFQNFFIKQVLTKRLHLIIS